MVAPTFYATSVDEVKLWMNEEGTSNAIDERLDQLIHAISERIEERQVLRIEQTTRVELPFVRKNDITIDLLCRPVFRVEEVRTAWDRDFSSSTSILDAATYYLDDDAGQIILDARWEWEKEGTLQVKYKGGLATSFAKLKADHPKIVQAANMWVADWYDRGAKITARQRTNGTIDLGSTVPRVVEQMLGPGPISMRI